MSEETARLFFGCALPHQISAALIEQASALPGAGRSADPDDLHLTLAFLGELPRERIGAAQRVGASLAGAPGFSLNLDRFGSFAHAAVIWAGFSEVPAELVELQARLNRELARAGFAVEQRAYQPHVTLRRRALLPPVVPGLRVPVWDVDSFALFESRAVAAGPRYHRLAAWPLG